MISLIEWNNWGCTKGALWRENKRCFQFVVRREAIALYGLYIFTPKESVENNGV